MTAPLASIVLGLSLGSLFADAGGAPAGSGEEPEVVRLTTVNSRSKKLSLGPGARGPIPERAWRAKIDEVEYTFFDLSGDGRLTPGGEDGIALEGVPFVVPLPDRLLVESGQYRLSVEGGELTLEREDLGLDPDLVRAASRVNDLRFRGARRPLVIDAEASEHALLHCRYLHMNGYRLGQVTMDVHQENPVARGYTAEGAEAGARGLISFGESFAHDLPSWYLTAFHGVALMDPALTRIGVARESGISLFYPVDREWMPSGMHVHPPDGAIEVPLAFWKGGEIPNPAPGTHMAQGCGFPLIVTVPTEQHDAEILRFELIDSRGDRVEGHRSAPSAPADEVLPKNASSAFFVPKAPLKPKTRYTARFQLEGMQEPLEWSFTTGKRR